MLIGFTGTGNGAETPQIGRLVGHGVTEIAFRVPYGTHVALGELLVGVEEGTGRHFLVRVTDIRHGAESAHDDWSERIAGNMLRLDDEGKAFPFHDREARLFALALAQPLGFLEPTARGATLRKPKTLPLHFSRVRRLQVDDLAFLAAFEQDLAMGDLRSGSDVLPYAVGVHGKWLPYHLGVFATTGMGKSNLMKRLLGSLMESRRYGVLVFDPHGEYYDGGAGLLPDGRKLQGLSQHPLAAERLAVFSSRPMPGPYNQLKISAYEIRASDVRNVFHFSNAQEEALWAIVELYGDGWLVELADKPLEEIQLDFPKKFFEGTLSVLKRRAEQILTFDVVHRDGAVTATSEVLRALDEARVVLVDSSGLYETEETLVSAILARTIFHRNKSLYKDRARFEKLPPCVIALEEAQRVLIPREGEQSIFAQIAREGRKFKTGLCAVTQQPKLIPEELLSQFNTYFILGLSDARDREIVSQSAKQDLSALQREIQTLEPGEAIVASPNVPFAVPAKVHLYEDYLARLPPSTNGGPGARPVATPSGFY
jgi:DNA helicase HerA-like ATPase